jgi:hypothetical protein
MREWRAEVGQAHAETRRRREELRIENLEFVKESEQQMSCRSLDSLADARSLRDEIHERSISELHPEAKPTPSVS